MIQFLLSLAYLGITAGMMAGVWRYRRGSPAFWHPVALALMAVGTFAMLDFGMESDRVYAALFFLAMVSFFAGSFLYQGTAPVGRALAAYEAKPETPATPEERILVVGLLLFSAVVTIAYYVAIGYNLFVLLLSGSIESSTSYSDLRLSTYSGDTYLAPGYVNQFKNTLLPLTVSITAFWLWQARRRGVFTLFMAVALPCVALALLGTGQRAFLVFAFFSLVFGLVLHGIGRMQRRPLPRIALFAVPVLVLLVSITAAYTGSGDEGLSATLLQVLSRFVSIQQESGLVGFRYTYPLPTAWFSEWWQGIEGILPSSEGSSLAHEVFAVMYGNMNGTAPVSTVGSAYYNGGVFGVALFYLVLGVAYSAAYHRFLNGPRSAVRSFSYGALFLVLTAYVADAPITLVDNGALAAVLFLALSKIRIGRADRVSPAGRTSASASI